MPVAHKSAISFGLVHIPVGLYTATGDNNIRFNQLCKKDKSRVRYKKVCAGCGKELAPADIVKGFEYEPGHFVEVTDEDFEKIKTEKDKSIHILRFAPHGDIPPVYFDKAYRLVPEKGGEKAYELLRRAMEEEGRVALAQSVLSSRDTPMVLSPDSDGILAMTMFYAEEIKAAPKAFARPEPVEAELAMARNLIGTMAGAFDPAAYQDTYQTRLRDLIEKKIQGKKIVTPGPEKQDNIIDLMEALERSIKQQKKPAAGKKAPARPTAKKGGAAKDAPAKRKKGA